MKSSFAIVNCCLILTTLMIFFACGGGSSSTSTSNTNNTTIPPNSNSSNNENTTESINAEKFTPPTGVCSTNDPDSPCPRRILLASSNDGINYTRLNKVLSDQGNTPNLFITANDRILIYYTAAYIDQSDAQNPKDGIAVAVSDDLGTNWEYYKVNFAGFGTGAPIVDPDIIQLNDGTFRMYITRGIEENGNTQVGILWADSTDGFNFTYGGVAATNGNRILDSLTLQINSTFHMYVLNPDGAGAFSYYTSNDGKSFAFSSETIHKIDNKIYILSNWLKEANSYRIFAFGHDDQDIRSFTTTDGNSLVADDHVFLKFSDDTSGLEKTWIKDAAIGKLSNGSFIMAYVAETP